MTMHWMTAFCNLPCEPTFYTHKPNLYLRLWWLFVNLLALTFTRALSVVEQRPFCVDNSPSLPTSAAEHLLLVPSSHWTASFPDVSWSGNATADDAKTSGASTRDTHTANVGINTTEAAKTPQQTTKPTQHVVSLKHTVVQKKLHIYEIISKSQ